MLTNQTISSFASSLLLLENHSNIRSHSDNCLTRFRVLKPCEDFVYRKLFLQGLNKGVGVNSWWIRIFIFITLEREALHFKNSIMKFQHNRPFTDIHTNTGGVTFPVRYILVFFFFTHFDFLLVLIGQDVKVHALYNMVIYWTVMAWCFFF